MPPFTSGLCAYVGDSPDAGVALAGLGVAGGGVSEAGAELREPWTVWTCLTQSAS